MVASGLGITVLPASANSALPQPLAQRHPFRQAVPSRRIALAQAVAQAKITGIQHLP
jgi:hypothetical protein